MYCNDINGIPSSSSGAVKESHPNCSRGAQTPTNSHHGSDMLTIVGRVTCNGGHIIDDGNNVCENNIKQ